MTPNQPYRETGQTDVSASYQTARSLPNTESDLRQRCLDAASGLGLLDVLVKRLLDLHQPEMEGLNLGHEDCDECDEWKHERLVCRDCRGTDDELWTFVLWPCPTVQYVADTLRVYPDQLRAVPDA
jgi:hypothetical protein